MIGSYQQQRRLEPEGPARGAELATVAGVYADGVALRFDGEAAPAQKHYKVNPSCAYAAGQRVYVQRVGGSYLVVCPVGAPTAAFSEEGI